MKAVPKWSLGLAALTLILGATAFAFRAGKPTFAKHVVEVLADGSIRCHGELLCSDASHPELLRQHLARIALKMPLKPAYLGNPDGPQLPDGRLDLHVDTKAQCGAVALATECLGAPGIRIWNLRLVPKMNGVAGVPMTFHLSKDFGPSCLRLLEYEPILVRISSVDDALAPGTSRLVYGVSNPTGRDPAGSGQLVYDNEDAQDPDALRQILLALHGKRPECAVELQTPPELAIARVLDTVRIAHEAGMTEIWAAGGAFVY